MTGGSKEKKTKGGFGIEKNRRWASHLVAMISCSHLLMVCLLSFMYDLLKTKAIYHSASKPFLVPSPHKNSDDEEEEEEIRQGGGAREGEGEDGEGEGERGE